ncbi:arrestin domain-containing protein 3-like [Girardinichthys multiradiatus]|uniref:arrestin domain-containing protein 3-like n=1 Tax=Girardinichthys multiradiatus TaxID=208333 RepID=UPI001FAD9924|nr:arrestin domain-containing protein 3-like [Girardinichthys multiradiatus]
MLPTLLKMTIKNLQIEYDAINSRNTFTNGDTINGRIILEVSKETNVRSLLFIAKGKARVCWSEHYGNNQTHVYWSNEKYYSVKHHMIRESRQDDNEVIGKGRHVFPFSFQIPDRKMPSSFHSTVGRIVHKLKVELKQSMKLTKKAKTHFMFVSKADMDTPGLMVPQHESKDKTLAFSSGNVSMDVYTKKMGYKLGETLYVTIKINNASSRTVKPKFELYEKKSFFAQGHRKVETHTILKEKADAVEAHSGKATVTKMITIPRELPLSILNCSILKLEYRIKVYLDIKCATDPKVKLPIVILPEDSSREPDEGQPLPPGGVGFEAFGNPNPQSWGTTSQVMSPPPPYEASTMYPSFPSDSRTAL